MHPLRLARIAAEAEGLRLRQLARRTAVQAVCGVVAFAFLIGTVAFVHVAAWCWLRLSWEGQYAALILAGADLLMAVLLGLLATRSSPGKVELEALAVRQRALEGATTTLAWSTMALQVLRVVGNLMKRSRG
jgi:hypothetical protein